MNLSQSLLGISFAHPIITSAGKWAWTAAQCREAVEGGAAGITTKSFGIMQRTGHPEPTVVRREHYTINAVGLPNDGVEAVREDLEPFLMTRPVPVILSVFADTVERFGETVAAYAPLGADALELNISCPNVQDDHGRPFSYLPETAAAVVRIAKESAGGLPLFAKLSPNVTNIGEIAFACVAAGVDGISLVNTLGPGMAIDLETRKPILSNKAGGLSGPALKPIAVRCISDVYKATEGKTPLIGVGGVESGEDAVELLLAGASLVGMGTAVLHDGYGELGRVAQELEIWCDAHGVKDIGELSGAIHRG